MPTRRRISVPAAKPAVVKPADIVNYINHIAFVIDASGSMAGLEKQVVTVFDKQIQELAQASKTFNQETRVSVYTFDSTIKNLIFDKDVLRLPSLAGLYRLGGSTALIDGTMQGIKDLQQTCQLYGDHAFLMYVLTDGGENASRKFNAENLKREIKAFADNWTMAALVPNAHGVHYCKSIGFPAQNVQVWETTAQGLNDVGNVMRAATHSYMQSRSQGVRSTGSLFQMDTSSLTKTTVKKELTELKPSMYQLLPVGREAVIKPFVEGFKIPYVQGCAYYQLTKPEKVQSAKQICVQDKQNGKMYTGQNARDLLGLPDYEVKVSPVTHGKYNIFVQSTSVNRKLVGGTNLLVMN